MIAHHFASRHFAVRLAEHPVAVPAVDYLVVAPVADHFVDPVDLAAPVPLLTLILPWILPLILSLFISISATRFHPHPSTH